MGLEFTEKVKKSWLKLLGLLVVQMKIGMKQAEESENLDSNTNSPNGDTVTLK